MITVKNNFKVQNVYLSNVYRELLKLNKDLLFDNPTSKGCVYWI